MNKAMNLNDVDDDDFGIDEITSNSDEDTNPQSVQESTEPIQDSANEPESLLDNPEPVVDTDSLVDAMLKRKQINADSVKFVNESGEVEGRKFNDLPLEEQLDILDANPDTEENNLGEDEIALINELRDGSLNVNEYKQYLKQQGIKDYLESIGAEQPITTSIDAISDDELYLADLKSKIPDITDEEALAKLESEKSNSDLFDKEIAGIRDLYTRKEQEQISLRDQEEARQLEEQQKEYTNSIISTIDADSSIDLGDSAIDLSDTEKDTIASFILDTDAAGNRHIAKALNDPKTLVGMSWYALYGQDAMRQLSEYYRQKITESSKNSYSKGYQDGRTGNNPTRTVIKPRKNNNRTMSINDIDF